MSLEGPFHDVNLPKLFFTLFLPVIHAVADYSYYVSCSTCHAETFWDPGMWSNTVSFLIVWPYLGRLVLSTLLQQLSKISMTISNKLSTFIHPLFYVTTLYLTSACISHSVILISTRASVVISSSYTWFSQVAFSL